MDSILSGVIRGIVVLRQRATGHASIQTTVDVYGHLAPGSNRNVVNKLDDDDTPQLRLALAAG